MHLMRLGRFTEICENCPEENFGMFVQHRERHRTDRIGWLRAAVLGANDGIVSTASLVVGVAAAHSTASDILVAGVAGLVAGAMSMAAGEYVSVSSQSDTENADLDHERKELAAEDESERNELAAIYATRGDEPIHAAMPSLEDLAHAAHPDLFHQDVVAGDK